MISHRGKHQALLVVVLTQDFVVTQIEFVAHAKSEETFKGEFCWFHEVNLKLVIGE